jgi:hypothetical protein
MPSFPVPRGTARKVPASFAGGNRWKVHHASPLLGSHAWRTICSDVTDAGLQDVVGGRSRVYAGDNCLPAWPLQIDSGQRRVEYADGTPFSWLRDTLWVAYDTGCIGRKFQQLAAARKTRGFKLPRRFTPKPVHIAPASTDTIGCSFSKSSRSVSHSFRLAHRWRAWYMKLVPQHFTCRRHVRASTESFCAISGKICTSGTPTLEFLYSK